MNIDPLFKEIIEKNSKEGVWEDIQDTIPEYLDEHWEDDFDDINEAYDETGRGEAERQIINSLIETGTHGLPIPILQHSKLSDMLAEYYELEIS